MRICVTSVSLLPVFLLGCAQLPRTSGEGQDVLLSFPNRLKPGERIEEFEVQVRNGKIMAFNKVPVDWLFDMGVEWPQSWLHGRMDHGAGAFGDTAALTRFLTLHRDGPAFDVTGSLVVSSNWMNLKTNFITKADFILEKAAPNESPADGSQPFRSETNRTSSAAGSHR